MKKKLTDNIPLKLMSVAIAVLVWLLVVNINNPIETNYYTIADVQLLNEGYVEETGQVCTPTENVTAVRVAVTANRKTLARIKETDIQATADLQQAVSLDTDPVMVPIAVTCPGIATGNIKVTPQNLSIHLETKETKEFVVNVSRGDSKPGKGYEVGTLVSNPEKIKITGPLSLVNKIDKVNATVNLEGKTEDTTETVSLTIIDKNQEEITSTEMNYLRIENDARVTVTARLWKVRANVGIDAAYVGEPAEGYQVGSITTIPETISVAGSNDALDNLAVQGNVISIPEDYIDVSGESKDVEKKISLKDLLPEGVNLTSDSAEDIWVKVNILPVGSEVYELDTSKIEVKNKPEDLQVTFETAKIEIRIKSEEGNLDDFVDEDIKASIDLKDKEEGSYEVPVDIVLPDGYEQIEDVTTEVKVSAVSIAEENEE